VQPGGLARSFIARAGARVAWRPGADVQRLERTPAGWRLCDASGATLAEAATVVLANAADALRLLGMPDWPLTQVRGQISLADAARLPTPRVPIAGRGSLLPAIDGEAMFGATAQPGDSDPTVREADHAANLAQFARLTGRPAALTASELRGRTAWRCSAVDKLPLIGAVPELAPRGTRLEQPRQVPRQPGLFVFTALGSRGITWSALGAQVLASWVTGAPAPIEASLLDALDPARFVSRQARVGRAPGRPRRAPVP
jgi:tRNA 5-methylaminomethyl-2-thiouridine biosynthesis bifunctional protein